MEETDKKVFGFWIYLMTDLIIFAVLFATFVVFRNSTFGGPTGRELFDMPSALKETLFLLTSSFSCSLAMVSVHRQKRGAATFWFCLTFALGVAFLFIEISEFQRFIEEGSGPSRSAFLSAFFALVGTHGFHISIGLLWMVVSIFHLWLRPLVERNISRILRMALFWHFLDFVWIFIFTTVYGMGHLG